MGNNNNNSNNEEQHIGNENDHVRQMVARAGRLWLWAPFYSQTPKPSVKRRAVSSKLLSSALASPSTLLVVVVRQYKDCFA